jgi:hypothetical protein
MEHVHIIKRQEVIDVLTQDAHYRKLGKWPLLTSNDLWTIPYNMTMECENMLLVKNNYLGSFNNINVGDSFNNDINHNYRAINNVLHKFKGNLVACGGSITNILTGFINDRNHRIEHRISDIDLFFYGLDNNMERANQMRIDVIKEIIKCHILYDDFYAYNIQRNEFVTSIFIYTKKDKYVEYQLIHRIYPSIDSIIGGFDIGACMFAYDGDEIYTTPLGAWTIINKTIIIDTKRRSTSYEFRLCRYHYRGFKLLFPGLSNNIDYFNNTNLILGDSHENEHDFKLKLLNFIKNNGFKFNNIDNVMSNCSIISDQSDNNISKQNLKIDHYGSISLTNYDHINITDKSLAKISDYNSYKSERCIPFSDLESANLTRIRLGNLNQVVSMIKNVDYNCLDIMLNNDIDNPNLSFNESTLARFLKKTDEIRKYKERGIGSRDDYQRFLKCFGHHAHDAMKARNDDIEYQKYCLLMCSTMYDNTKLCEEKLKGIKWITTNPGRQWTSSINPIVSDPRNWYGENYIPVKTGIPEEIETCLRIIYNRIWADILPKDVFNIILFYLNKYYADAAWKYVDKSRSDDIVKLYTIYMASQQPPWARASQVQLPYIQMPQVQLPYMGIQQAMLPPIQAQPLQMPMAIPLPLPQIQLPQIQLPQIQLPQIQLPQIQLPQIQLPQQVQLPPQMQLPQIQTPISPTEILERYYNDYEYSSDEEY